MIQLKLITPTKTFVLDPLDGLTIPSNMQLNDNLQHQEAQLSVRVAYDVEVLNSLIENSELQAQLLDNNTPIFSGIIDTGVSWTDNGNPEPLDNIPLVINDNTYKLQQTTEDEFACINLSLAEITRRICLNCGLSFEENSKAESVIIPAFVLKAEQEYYQAFSDLLFEYKFTFGFTPDGKLCLIDLDAELDNIELSDLYSGVKVQKTKKKFTGVKLSYGKLTAKENEQIYFEGGNLNEDSKVVPYIITPGSYYPVEATPLLEEENGQVYQDFAQGFAETKTLYNGEKKLQRSQNTELIYSTNHYLVEDWTENLSVDRTDFKYTQASVRFYNASDTDAELRQLAIRATAYYRSDAEYILGTGKKYSYDTSYIYDTQNATNFAEFLSKYFLGGNLKITFKTDKELTPGQKIKINTNTFSANVKVLAVNHNYTFNIFEISAITEQIVSLAVKKNQTQSSMSANQQLQRTEISAELIDSIIEEYYLSDSRTELINGTWQTTPVVPTNKQYVWTRTTFIYSDGSKTTTEPISVSGEQGTDGKNAIVMTSASAPNGEYNGQIGIWQGQVYSWNGTSWVLTSGILPTDPVLHYSFDDLPSIPDGTSLINKDKNFDASDTYLLRGTASIENDDLKITKNVTTDNAYTCFRIKSLDIASTNFQNSIVKVKIFVNSSSYSVSLRVLNSRDSSEFFARNIETNKWVEVIGVLPNANVANPWIGVTFPTGSESNYFLVEELYIGDATYTIPVIDNSGNNYNATDVKGPATKGVSGNCYRTLQNGYIVAKSPLNWNSQYEYSFSTWIKRYESSVYIANNWDRYSVSTLFLTLQNYADINSFSRVDVYTKEGKVNRYIAELSLPPIGEWFHYVATVKDGVAVVFINGEKQNFRLDYHTEGFHTQTPELLQIGRSFGGSGYVTYDAEYDDFQIFDRALSDQEVLGLYLARGNTPKQFTLNDYRLNLIDDDGVISVSEKKELLSRWKEIYNAENVSSVLPTSNISSKGEYKAVIDSANSLSIGNITAITNYKESANALRDAFWGSNGYLVNMTTASTLSGNLDSLFANYKEALQNANNAISDQQSAQASAITVQMASPFVQLPVNDNGSVTSYDNSGNIITALNGAVTLTPVSATAALDDNQYSVTASGSGITAGSVSVDTTNKKVTIGNSTALTKPTAQITYTIKFKINGTTGTLYAQQKISTASRGADGKRGPIYRGTTKPTTDVVNGDWYLDTSDNFIHWYNGSNWNNTVTDYDDYRYKPAINDMINLAATNPNVPFLSVTNAWIKNLAAGNILAGEITTKELELTGDGVIKSEIYINGISGFKIDSNGVAEFNNGVIKTPELNFAGVKGLDDNLLKNGYRLKPIFNDWGQGYFGEEPVYRCAGYDSDGKVVALYLGCSYELSFSGTLNIYLAKNEHIYCSEICKSVNFRTVISDVSADNVSPYPIIGSSVRNVLAFTNTSSNFWSANVADKIFSVSVKAGQYITCFVEALLSAPAENVGTIYSRSIEDSGTSNAYKESALYIKKENKIAKDLLKGNEKVFNESIFLTRGTGVYDVRGVGSFGNYFISGNVLVQWGQTKSYTVLQGNGFTETINLPIAYNDAGDVVGNATGLDGYNVIMSPSTKNGGGIEYFEIWGNRTNSSFAVRLYNRNGTTKIDSISLRWMTIGYLN